MNDIADESSALERRDRRARALTELSSELIGVIGSQGTLTFANAPLARLLGPLADGAIPARLLRALVRTDRRRVRTALRALAGGAACEWHGEFQLRAADGRLRCIEARAVDRSADPDVCGILLNARDVTDSQLVEREQHAALLEAGVSVWELDTTTRRMRWITGGAQPPHVAAGEDPEAAWKALLHPEDAGRVVAAFRDLEQGASDRLHIEYRLRGADGAWHHLIKRAHRVNAASAGGSAPTRARFLRGVSIDVTERRNAEEQQARAHERMQQVLQYARISMYERDLVADTVSDAVDWSRDSASVASAMASGHAARWRASVHPQDLQRAQQLFAEHARGETAFAELEYRRRAPDGRWVWIFDRVQITARATDGTPLKVAGVCFDIDRRKRAEIALRQSESRLLAAEWGAEFGLWELDVESGEGRWFSNWCDVEDIDPCEGPEHVRRWDERVHPEDLAQAPVLCGSLYSNARESYEAEYRVRTRSGEWRWILERARVAERAPDGAPVRIVGICINVQARKQAEQALRKSELRFRSVVEFSPGYVCEFAVDEQLEPTLVWVSSGFEKVFGVSLAEFNARGHFSFDHPDDRQGAIERSLRLVRGENVSGEKRIVRADGTIRWLQITTRPVVDARSGRVTAAIGIAHDVTERKLAEEALRESQLHLRWIAEHSSDWLMLIDLDDRVLFINRPITSDSRSDVVGRRLPIEGSVVPAERLRSFVHEVRSSERGCEFEQQFFDPERGQRSLLVRGHCALSGGRVVGIVVTATEITKQRRDERMLTLQARILETMREGVVLFDRSHCIRLTNPAFEKLFGADQGELTGHSLKPLFGSSDVVRRITEAPTPGASEQPIEFECTRFDGSRFAAQCVVTPLVVDGQDHWLAVLNDVTDRRTLEREILEVSNREQQRIGYDLHDGLGQELTGIALMLSALAERIRRDDPARAPEVEGIVALLGQSIESARRLAHGLSPVSVELGGLLPALRKLAERACEAYGLSVTVRTRMSEALRLDAEAATHLYRIVQEALSNAMRHGAATRVRILLSADRHVIRLSVHDNGTGMPAEPNSTGLGQRTMRYRARMIGGALQVEPHRLGGTIVRCECPQGARSATRPDSVDADGFRVVVRPRPA
jgi:PAS domain S-box-containing protein